MKGSVAYHAVLFVALCGFSAAGSDTLDALPEHNAVPSSTDPPDWRQSRRCGVNSLFILHRLLKKESSYDDLQYQLGDNQHGHSMLDLIRVSSESGVRLRAVRTVPRNLSLVPLPAIALTEGAAPEVGHYVVLIGVDANSVRLLDGTSGMITVESTQRFSRIWNGELLIAGDSGVAPTAVILFLSGALLLLAVLISGRSSRSHTTNKSVHKNCR